MAYYLISKCSPLACIPRQMKAVCTQVSYQTFGEGYSLHLLYQSLHFCCRTSKPRMSLPILYRTSSAISCLLLRNISIHPGNCSQCCRGSAQRPEEQNWRIPSGLFQSLPKLEGRHLFPTAVPDRHRTGYCQLHRDGEGRHTGRHNNSGYGLLTT